VRPVSQPERAPSLASGPHRARRLVRWARPVESPNPAITRPSRAAPGPVAAARSAACRGTHGARSSALDAAPEPSRVARALVAATRSCGPLAPPVQPLGVQPHMVSNREAGNDGILHTTRHASERPQAGQGVHRAGLTAATGQPAPAGWQGSGPHLSFGRWLHTQV
jgi:hypothetical protein